MALYELAPLLAQISIDKVPNVGTALSDFRTNMMEQLQSGKANPKLTYKYSWD
jgi:hypothetical protein